MHARSIILLRRFCACKGRQKDQKWDLRAFWILVELRASSKPCAFTHRGKRLRINVQRKSVVGARECTSYLLEEGVPR